MADAKYTPEYVRSDPSVSGSDGPPVSVSCAFVSCTAPQYTDDAGGARSTTNGNAPIPSACCCPSDEGVVVGVLVRSRRAPPPPPPLAGGILPVEEESERAPPSCRKPAPQSPHGGVDLDPHYGMTSAISARA
jgi:hypothetical protein